MSIYTLEVQLNTSQYFLMLATGVAEDFKVGGFNFSVARKDFDKRPGFRYFVSKDVSAQDMNTAYTQFMIALLKVADSIAFFYTQPVTVENWNILIKKTSSDKAYFGSYKLSPAVSMPDYDSVSEELTRIIERVNQSDDLHNTMWLYNNIAKIDSVDHDPAYQQFGLCQLAESLADKETVPGCVQCGRGSYTRTDRDDMKDMLGKDLYNKLYGGGDILRNRLAHGSLVGGSFLDNKEVEDVVLKISDRVSEKFGLRNKVTAEMQDRIRATNVYRGSVLTIEHENRTLEECLDLFLANNLHGVANLPQGW